VRPGSPQGQQQSQQRRIAKLRQDLARERASLERWQKRLRRAFHAVEKQHRLVHRVEDRITRLEGR